MLDRADGTFARQLYQVYGIPCLGRVLAFLGGYNILPCFGYKEKYKTKPCMRRKQGYKGSQGD
jgi:hypothetical protein